MKIAEGQEVAKIEAIDFDNEAIHPVNVNLLKLKATSLKLNTSVVTVWLGVRTEYNGCCK